MVVPLLVARISFSRAAWWDVLLSFYHPDYGTVPFRWSRHTKSGGPHVILSRHAACCLSYVQQSRDLNLEWTVVLMILDLK